MQASDRDSTFGLIQILGAASTLPLDHITVQGQIIGPLVSIDLQQWFSNPFQTSIEVEYLFPLPAQAALVDFQLRIGERTIQAALHELQAGRRAYQEAVQSGQRASLLEERRPNMFAVKIGNIQPGEGVMAMLRYENSVQYHEGTYEFVFPMGVMP